MTFLDRIRDKIEDFIYVKPSPLEPHVIKFAINICGDCANHFISGEPRDFCNPCLERKLKMASPGNLPKSQEEALDWDYDT